MPNPTAAAAAAFLVETGEAMPGAVRPGLDGPISGAAPDQEAGPDDAAWLAARAATPERLSAFQGRLLVVPAGTDPAAVPAHATVVAAANPRLAFSRLLERFFAHRAEPGWDAPHDPVRIGHDVRLAPGVVIGHGVELGDGVRVGPNTALAHCTLGDGVEVGANCTIGGAGFGYTRSADGRPVRFPHLGRVAIESDVTIGSNTCIDRAALGETRIGRGTRIDNLVHIAHNVRIGRDCLVIAHAMIAGSVVVEDGAWVAPAAAVRNGLTVGAGATVGMAAVVVRDVAPGSTVAGSPAREMGT